MYTRRKVFSTIEIDGEEKLFSVNETELSYGSEEEQREYTEKKLSRQDRKRLEKATDGKKHRRFNKNNEHIRKYVDDEDYRAKCDKNHKIFGSSVLGAQGAMMGHLKNKASMVDNPITKVGTIAANAIGNGLIGYGAASLDTAITHKHLKKGKLNKRHDLALVHDGKMTKEEFIEKYGK